MCRYCRLSKKKLNWKNQHETRLRNKISAKAEYIAHGISDEMEQKTYDSRWRDEAEGCAAGIY